MNYEEKNKVENSTLYLVATPIGNLSDISERALKVLSEVDMIAAEDTRNTLRLLGRFKISKPLISYHEHNKREAGEKIAERLERGESCALVTDAGTPAISDPGEDLVALCIERGIKVTSVPGACAMVSALILSGLPTRRFTFEGFLPVPKKERKERLLDLQKERKTIILHEAPHKLRATLDDLAEYLGGDRRIALCRELTKLNEEVIRMSLSEASEHYKTNEPRGEYVLVIEGGNGESEREKKEPKMSPRELLAYYESKGLARKEAMTRAASDFGVSKNQFYDLILEKE